MTTDVPIAQIQRFPHQPSRRMESDIDSLADSIQEHGQLHPAIGRIIMGQHVLTDFEQDPGKYLESGDAYVQLISGHRRWQAMYEIAERTGRDVSAVTLEVDIRALSDEEAAEIHYEENDSIYAKSKVQEAELMHSYDEDGWTHAEIAERFGVTRPTVSRRLSLMSLPERVRDKIESDGGMNCSTAHRIVPAWELLPSEKDAVTEYHDETIEAVRDRLISAAEERTHEEVEKLVESLIELPLRDDSDSEGAASEEAPPEEAPGEISDESSGAESGQMDGISAVPADLADDAAEKGATENGSPGESSPESAPESPPDSAPKEDGPQAVEVKVDGDLEPGTYRLVAESGDGEDLTGEEKEQAARAAAQLVMDLGPETDAVQDLARVVGWALGTPTDPFRAMEALFRRGLEDDSLDTLSLNSTLDRA